MNKLMIIKRTGDVVPFDSDRIKNAILHAVRATNSQLEAEILNKILADILEEVHARFTDFYPNVENIQDLVEKQLILNELIAISKEYIIYRAKQKEKRESARQENIEKSLLGKLKVTKLDGRTVIFDLNKVKSTLTRLAGEHAKLIDEDLILKELLNNIYDGVTTTEIEKALVLAISAYIEKDPAYSLVAARVFLQRLYKEVIGKSVNETTFEQSYREAFVTNIQTGVDNDLFSKDLLSYELAELAAYIKPERDNLLQYISVQTLYERYFQKVDKRRIETPQFFWMRVAMGLSLNEKEDRVARVKEFYDILSELYFVSSTPTLFHSGTPRPQLSSCYLNTVTDDLGEIFKSYGDNAQLSKWSGGIGTDWTYIRGTGAWINTTKVESQGVIPFLKIANDVTAAINRSGKRRGASCAYLETWHFDIEDFLDLRKNTGDDRRRTHDMNTANWIPDLFMQRVQAGGDWTLFSPDEVPELHDLYGNAFKVKYEEYEAKAEKGEIRKFKKLSAVKLWRKMISMLFETGHPWITFKDPCNIRSPQDHVGVVHNSNLCTEITLNTSPEETAVCNLGSINLAKHVTANGEMDRERLAKTVKTAVLMLDNVVDINYYPTKEAKNSNMKHRPVGLGVMGVQDFFFKLDLSFDSQAAEDMTDELQEYISYNAILASSTLAKEKGTYESYKGSKWDRNLFPQDTLALLEQERGQELLIPKGGKMDWTPVREHVKAYGMRNSNVMAVAPTATISTIAGCFPTIEPIYKNIYVKANMSGEFTIVNAYLIEDLKKINMWNDEMLDQLKYYDGDVSMISGIPEALKLKYRESFQVDSMSAVRHTARRGKWIDQSQSHNIFLRGTSGKLISETYQYAWECGLKTTYYLRSLGATQIEKSTLDAKKYGYTQKREYSESKTEESLVAAPAAKPAEPLTVPVSAVGQKGIKMTKQPEIKLCRIEDPDCEACQ